jgi:hypothetical protein
VTWNSFGSGYSNVVETSFSNGGTGYTGPIAFDLAPLVQAWTSGAIVNDGIATTNSTWSSSEDATAARRPRLDVCYLP